MDDVKAMNRAGETVGKAVGSGWGAMRRGAKRAGHAGAEATLKAAQAADRKLTEHGVAPQHLTEALVESAEVARQEVVKSSRRARKKLARTAKHTRKDLARAAKEARKNAARSKPATKAKKSAKQAKREAKELRASLKEAGGAKRRRRWPKVLLIIVVGGGIAYAVRSITASTSTQTAPVPEPRQREGGQAGEQPEAQSGDGQRNGQPASKSATKQS